MSRLPADLVETLAAVVDEGSLDAASRRLHITPSAVSQRLRALEQLVGRVLVVRSKPVRPTEAAGPLLRYARQLALLEHDALAGLPGAAAAEIGVDQGAVGDAAEAVSIPLAVNADSLATWFLAPLARVAARHPVVFDLHRDDQDFTAALLESGTVMGAVASRAEPVAGCRVSSLGVLRYEAVATPGFAARWFSAGAGSDALALAPVIDFDRRDDLQTQWLVACGADPTAPPRHRVPASQDFAAATVLGLGWALLPRFQSDPHLASGALVPLGGPPIDVPLYWQQWNLRSPLLDAVADEIVAEGRRVLLPGQPSATRSTILPRA